MLSVCLAHHSPGTVLPNTLRAHFPFFIKGSDSMAAAAVQIHRSITKNGAESAVHCDKWVNMLLLNVILRLWWQPKETGTFLLPPNTAAQGVPLQTFWASCHSTANQHLPATGRKLAGCTGIQAKVLCFWLFLELTCSPNLLPALASSLVWGLAWERGLAGFPALLGRRKHSHQLVSSTTSSGSLPWLCSQHCAWASSEKRIFFF